MLINTRLEETLPSFEALPARNIRVQELTRSGMSAIFI
jgi:hypothetical protein